MVQRIEKECRRGDAPISERLPTTSKHPPRMNSQLKRKKRNEKILKEKRKEGRK